MAPGSVQGNLPPYGDAPPAFTNHPDPAITAAGRYPAAYTDPEPEPEPAWPSEQPELPWWQKNRPPDQS